MGHWSFVSLGSGQDKSEDENREYGDSRDVLHFNITKSKPHPHIRIIDP